MKKSGSSIILVLCVVSAVTVLVTIALRGSLFTFELALERVRCEKQFWIMNAYEQYAIAYINTHVNNMSEVVTLSPIMCDDYQGTIIVMPNKNKIDVSVQLQQGDQLLQKVSFKYDIIFKDNGEIHTAHISNWRIDENE